MMNFLFKPAPTNAIFLGDSISLHFIRCTSCIALACFFVVLPALAQLENVALHFSGAGEYIELPASPVQGNNDFTLEAKVTTVATILPGTFFRRLFVLSGQFNTSLPFTRFEVGENGGDLVLFWSDAAGSSSFNTISVGLQAGDCYHIAVVRRGANVEVFLDGNSVFATNTLGTLNTALFRVGHWHGNLTPMQDWHGEVDDVRLWGAPRIITEIQDFKDCIMGGSWPNLLVNWTFDQIPQGVVPNGSNSGANALDMSGNNNNGQLTFFILNGNTSNFISSTCKAPLTLNVTDLGSQSISLANICSGTGVHFCILQSNAPPPGLSGATVLWEFFDQGISTQWMPITSNPFPNNLCFGVQALDISAICLTSPTGFLDRKYRAIVIKGTPPLTCTYITSEHQLRIHCPVTDASITFTPSIPAPPNVALCEGTSYTTAVSLNSSDAFIPSGLPPNGNLDVQWCINGIHDPALNNLPSFIFTDQPVFPDLCFEVKVSNGLCPQLTSNTCIPVDKMPMCGTIDVKSEPALMQDPNGGQYDYLICPGNDVELMMLNPADFKDCDAVWQFMFPSAGIWNDLNGIGNTIQNTGTLSQDSPPNPFSPWVWPQGETCILYRIECRTKHYPLSDCVPCHSNQIQICLKQPKPAPVITATQNPICAQGAVMSSIISVSPFDPNCSYAWYCNGLLVGNGSSIVASEMACYWVEVSDGCFLQTSNPLNLDVCEIVPVIECPQDNPCACLGTSITLTSNIAYNNCGISGLLYTWTASSGLPLSGVGSQFVHDPDPNGTTYMLTVTDPNNPGCIGTSKPLTIEPCK
jgi:hypothetical protein